MNPAFVLLVLLSTALLWFLLSFAFRPIGKVLSRLWQDAIDEMNREDKEKEKKE